MMRLTGTGILFYFLALPVLIIAQEENQKGLGSGSDLCIYDSQALSLGIREAAFVHGSEVVFCPSGIKRSSGSDIGKRYAYDWVVKYNNIYLRNGDGIVYEGMNESGFSASLLFFEDARLPEKEKGLIPIGTSVIVNFFIDHFTNIDTALLAIWDIRVFDDLGLTGGWPFRIILHDTSGATAYIEYGAGGRSVYTPDHPSFIVAGADYARLINLEYIPEAIPETNTEVFFLDIVIPLRAGMLPNPVSLLLSYYMHNFAGKTYYNFFRYHHDRELYILTPTNDEAVFNFREIDFSTQTEVSTIFF